MQPIKIPKFATLVNYQNDQQDETIALDRQLDFDG